MFDSRNQVINKVFNPLNVTKGSIIEFSVGQLADTGIYRFSRIVEFNFGERTFSRYVIYSKSEDTEYVFEVFPGNGGKFETYLYSLSDTVPFSDEFLEVAGQRYLTTPQGNEYTRCIMPEEDDRIDGVKGKMKVYNIETGEIETSAGVVIWDYKRDADGKEEYLNIEMSESTGMFKIFIGEMIEDIFYKFYQTSKA